MNHENRMPLYICPCCNFEKSTKNKFMCCGCHSEICNLCEKMCPRCKTYLCGICWYNKRPLCVCYAKWNH